MSSLPLEKITKGSDKDTRLFFDRYFTKSISLNSNELDTVVGFFKKRGFDENAATAVSIVLLNQAKLDKIPVYKLIDTLNDLNELKLSVIVAEVLNYNRTKTSSLGFKRDVPSNKKERRNIVP